MKSIIQSIRPQYVRDILNGIKVTEVRKSYIEPPFTSHTYCTKAKHKNDYLVFNEQFGKYELTTKSDKALNGKVVAEFVCDKVDEIIYTGGSYDVKGESKAYTNQVASKSCLQFPDLRDYLGAKTGYGLHITELKIYDKPKELGEFCRQGTFDDCDFVECVTENHKEVYKYYKQIEKAPQDFMYVEELK